MDKNIDKWMKGYDQAYGAIKFTPTADEIEHPFGASDAVNSPSHYTRGKVEVIDIIEDAIQDAPSIKDGFLQAQVLKYMLRLWLKVDSKEDAEKARWYLNRLIESLECESR